LAASLSAWHLFNPRLGSGRELTNSEPRLPGAGRRTCATQWLRRRGLGNLDTHVSRAMRELIAA